MLLPISVEPAPIAGSSARILPRSGVSKRASCSAPIETIGAGVESSARAIREPVTEIFSTASSALAWSCAESCASAKLPAESASTEPKAQAALTEKANLLFLNIESLPGSSLIVLYICYVVGYRHPNTNLYIQSLYNQHSKLVCYQTFRFYFVELVKKETIVTLCYKLRGNCRKLMET